MCYNKHDLRPSTTFRCSTTYWSRDEKCLFLLTSKCTKLVFLDTVSNHTQFSHVNRLEFCHMLYFTNALPYYETLYVFSPPFLTVLKGCKEIGYCNETGLNIFFGSCREHLYQLQNWLNFLSTNLIVKNLLFRTPKQLV